MVGLRRDVKFTVSETSTQRTPMVPTLEYVVRLVCGFMFGCFVGFSVLSSNTAWPVAAAIPFACGAAAVVFGDRFWYWAFKHAF